MKKKPNTEQKEIDDAILKETQRQRDEYYDELLKLRSEKIAVINKACESIWDIVAPYVHTADKCEDIQSKLRKVMEE